MNFRRADFQEATFWTSTILCTSGKSPIMRHYDSNQPLLLETVTSTFPIGGILSQHFKHGMIHPVGFLSRQFSQADLNYDVFPKEMLAIVWVPKWWRSFLQGSVHTTIIYTNHQNLTYFKSSIKLNREPARWAEELATCNFDVFDRKGSSNGKANALWRRPELTSREGGTTATEKQTLLRKEQRLEVGAMEIEDDQYEHQKIAAHEVDHLLLEAKNSIHDQALRDNQYPSICTNIDSNDDTTHTNFWINGGILHWQNRCYVPEGIREGI